MTDRAQRIRRLRRKVAVSAAATFAAAFGTVALAGSHGSATTSTAAATAETETETDRDAVAATMATQTAQVPSPVTTQQS